MPTVAEYASIMFLTAALGLASKIYAQEPFSKPCEIGILKRAVSFVLRESNKGPVVFRSYSAVESKKIVTHFEGMTMRYSFRKGQNTDFHLPARFTQFKEAPVLSLALDSGKVIHGQILGSAQFIFGNGGGNLVFLTAEGIIKVINSQRHIRCEFGHWHPG